TQALAHERQLLLDLMNNVPDGIYFTDRDQKVVRANDAYAHTVGYPDSQTLMSETAEHRLVLSPQYVVGRQVLETGMAVADRVRRTSSATCEQWVSETLAPIREGDGTISGLVGIVRDVTH